MKQHKNMCSDQEVEENRKCKTGENKHLINWLQATPLECLKLEIHGKTHLDSFTF